jgi:hypothetical protein
MGNVHTTGKFGGRANFDPGPGSVTITADISDIFVSKLNSSGEYLWAVAMTGPSTVSKGVDPDVDDFGNVFITGGFHDLVDFDPGPEVMTFTSIPSGVFLHPDAFIAALDSSGGFLWARQIGTPSID